MVGLVLFAPQTTTGTTKLRFLKLKIETEPSNTRAVRFIISAILILYDAVRFFKP